MKQMVTFTNNSTFYLFYGPRSWELTTVLCERKTHKVRIYKEYHSVCPLVGIRTLPCNPSLAIECAPPPRTGRGGGHTRLRVRGWGCPNSDDLRKSLALCLLCGTTLHILFLNLEITLMKFYVFSLRPFVYSATKTLHHPISFCLNV